MNNSGRYFGNTRAWRKYECLSTPDQRYRPPPVPPFRNYMLSQSSGNAKNVRIACLGDNLVTKSAPMEYLRGELHFYRSIPPELTHLFPTLVGASEDASQALPSMTMTKASEQNPDLYIVFSCFDRGGDRYSHIRSVPRGKPE